MPKPRTEALGRALVAITTLQRKLGRFPDGLVSDAWGDLSGKKLLSDKMVSFYIIGTHQLALYIQKQPYWNELAATHPGQLIAFRTHTKGTTISPMERKTTAIEAYERQRDLRMVPGGRFTDVEREIAQVIWQAVSKLNGVEFSKVSQSAALYDNDKNFDPDARILLALTEHWIIHSTTDLKTAVAAADSPSELFSKRFVSNNIKIAFDTTAPAFVQVFYEIVENRGLRDSVLDLMQFNRYERLGPVSNDGKNGRTPWRDLFRAVFLELRRRSLPKGGTRKMYESSESGFLRELEIAVVAFGLNDPSTYVKSRSWDESECQCFNEWIIDHPGPINWPLLATALTNNNTQRGTGVVKTAGAVKSHYYGAVERHLALAERHGLDRTKLYSARVLKDLADNKDREEKAAATIQAHDSNVASVRTRSPSLTPRCFHDSQQSGPVIDLTMSDDDDKEQYGRTESKSGAARNLKRPQDDVKSPVVKRRIVEAVTLLDSENEFGDVES